MAELARRDGECMSGTGTGGEGRPCRQRATHKVGVLATCGHPPPLAVLCEPHAQRIGDSQCEVCGAPVKLTEAVLIR